MNAPEWYEIADNDAPVFQGDILFSIPLILTKDDPYKGSIDVEVEEYQGIILSQSCDLINKEIDVILFCPVITMVEWIGKIMPSGNVKDMRYAKNNLRKGGYVSYYLLNKFNRTGFPDDYFVVDLKNPRSFPFEYLESVMGRNTKRLRLNTPYREHLSQAFARVFMRVGLPDSIPEFSE